MYGGHITDEWDRRLCRTYLEEFIKPEMLEGELSLAPGFPLPGNMDYSAYHQVGTWVSPRRAGDAPAGPGKASLKAELTPSAALGLFNLRATVGLLASN